MNGQAKHQLTLAGKTLLDHVIERAAPQVDQLLINVNPPVTEEIDLLSRQLPLIEDRLSGHLGPLAGIHAALEWMHSNSSHRWLASFAVDSPLFPMDLVTRLLCRTQDSEDSSSKQLICPTYAGHKQPTFCLWHIDQREPLRRWLVEEKNYRMGAWLKQQKARLCDFSQEIQSLGEVDPFTNINTPEQLEQLEHQLNA